MPVMGETSNAEIGNALSILLVEENGYIVKNIRTIGLSDEIMKILRGGMVTLPEISMYEILDIYQNYSQDELFEGGASHFFPGILDQI